MMLIGLYISRIFLHTLDVVDYGIYSGEISKRTIKLYHMTCNIINLKRVLEDHKDLDLAFVIGNGVNRYIQGNDDWSWKNILCKAWGQFTNYNVSCIEGMSLTEMYDILELHIERNKADSLKEKIIEPFKEGCQLESYEEIRKYLEHWDVPVLTTNFDHMLEMGYSRMTLKHPLITGRYYAKNYYYPWDRYFSNKQIHDAAHDYAIWHINGFVDFPKSIKLSSSEYIAQASYSRAYIHKNSMDDFYNKNINNWIGYNTWLHPIFNCSLCFIGLSLNEDETFLRWLLLERKKYYKKFPDRVHQGWYVYKEDEMFQQGKELFMKGVGLEPVAVKEYSEIYEDLLKK